MSIDVNPLPDSDSHFTVTFSSGYFTHSILTTVTSSSSTVSTWIAETLDKSPTVVGLDCEWHPNFISGTNNPVATLQLSVSDCCLIFQFLHSDNPHPLALHQFLSNPQIKFAGVGIKDDADKIQENYNLEVSNMVDLRSLALEKMGQTRTELKGMGLARLAEEVIGVEVNKPRKVRLSKWDAEVLNHDQIGYGCVDAFLSFEIASRLFGLPTFLVIDFLRKAQVLLCDSMRASMQS